MLLDCCAHDIAIGGLTPDCPPRTATRNSIVTAATQELTKGGGIGGAGATIENAKKIGEAIKGIFGGQKKTQ